MKKILSLVTLAVIVISAVITNPDETKHKKAVKLTLQKFIDKKIEQNKTESSSFIEKAGFAFGEILGEEIIDQAVNKIVERKNYYLFSLTNINFNNQTKTIGIGAFGYVYISKKVDKALDKEFEKIKDLNF